MKKITSLLFCLCIAISTVNAQFSGGGNGTEQNPYKVATAADVSIMQSFVGAEHADKHFRLMNNVDMTAFLGESGNGWTPIGDDANAFHGHIDGGGYEIQGLWSSGSTYADFVGYLRGSIDNIGVSISTSKSISGSYAGGLVGYSAGGSITNCHTTGNVSESSHADGLVGYATGDITNCYATGDVSGIDYVGGLVGYATGAITDSYAAGNVSGRSYTGGLVGYATGAITSCYTTGDVTGTYSSYSNSYYSQYYHFLFRRISRVCFE